MKFIRFVILTIFLFSSCVLKKRENVCKTYPPYALLLEFSKKIKPETNLVLCSYAVNWCLFKKREEIKGVENFHASYFSIGMQDDEISLNKARNLIVCLTENLLKEINSNEEVKQDLSVYPFNSELLNITIHFVDEKKIELGQGVASAYFSNGKITYEGYNIIEYSEKYPALGKHYTIHEETYAEAFDIVKKQGNLKYL